MQKLLENWDYKKAFDRLMYKFISLSPLWPCKPSKLCKSYKNPGCMNCDIQFMGRLGPINYKCRMTRNPLHADWQQVFKFLHYKWVEGKCRHFCCACEFAPEHYEHCVWDDPEGFGRPLKQTADKKRRKFWFKRNKSKIFGFLLGVIVGATSIYMAPNFIVTSETVEVPNEVRPVNAENTVNEIDGVRITHLNTNNPATQIDLDSYVNEHALDWSWSDVQRYTMTSHHIWYEGHWATELPVAEAQVNPYEPFIVECSAYCYTGNLTASGKPTVEGVTIAGKKEWLGRTAILYEVNDDGGIGEFIGYREFTDTGYGQPSTLYPGYGTIQTGECVDLYFDDRQTALEWGRKKIYIQVIEGCG